MEKQFEVFSRNTLRLLAIFFSGLLVSAALGISSMYALRYLFHYHRGIGHLMLCFLVFFIGVCITIVLMGKFSVISLHLTITPDRLSLLNRKTGIERAIPFANIASYRVARYYGAEDLRLKILDNEWLTLTAGASRLASQPSLSYTQAFEEALQESKSANPHASSPAREKSFFETPVSTVILVLILVIVGGVLWDAISQHKPIKGSFFISIAFVFAYLVAWYAARNRRRT